MIRNNVETRKAALDQWEKDFGEDHADIEVMLEHYERVLQKKSERLYYATGELIDWVNLLESAKRIGLRPDDVRSIIHKEVGEIEF